MAAAEAGRIWGRRLAKALFATILVASVAVLVGTLVPRPLLPAPRGEPTGRRILLLSNPIHTDIAIELSAAIRDRFAFLAAAGIPLDHPGARWLIFGWGGRAFYLETPTWADLRPMPLAKALTVDTSVMHVELAGPFDEGRPAVRAIHLGEAGFERLLAFIDASFRRDDAPLPIEGASYGDYDWFFEGNGRFNALMGCNTWTAAALRAAGLRTGWWNPLPVLLEMSLEFFNDPAVYTPVQP